MAGIPTDHSRPRPTIGSFERLEPRLPLAAEAAVGWATRLPSYDTGAPVLRDLWVDPTVGSDTATGATRGTALRTVAEAWRRVPAGVPLTTGVRINLVAGTYDPAAVPHYWENRFGTLRAPVILRAADGAGSARLPALNVFGCRHLQIDGLEISAGGGDVAHFESCTHLLIRDTTIRGLGTIATYDCPQEALKVNQSQHVFIERCDISGAWDNAVDFVAVQFGHVVGSRIHRAGDWAMYVKGGSALITVAGNEFFDAGTGGFTAGQGTGLEFMVPPWIRHEATSITFRENEIHDVEGAGVGVNGGAAIVIQDNVMANVGSRSHVIEVGFGSRSCDGDAERCRALLARGGWGTAVPGTEAPIPNRDVSILRNVVLNPDGAGSRWQHFAIATTATPPAGSNLPGTVRADTGLVIADNVIWNGPPDHPLGIEPAALAATVAARNAINLRRPVLADPEHGDYRVVSAGPPAAPPLPALAVSLQAIAPVAGQPLTTISVTFNRPVQGVSIDDFVLRRGTTDLPLAGAAVTTIDGRIWMITSLPGTHLAGTYSVTLKARATGIIDAFGAVLGRPVGTAWRQTTTVAPRG